jgi:hypothetical protein
MEKGFSLNECVETLSNINDECPRTYYSKCVLKHLYGTYLIKRRKVFLLQYIAGIWKPQERNKEKHISKPGPWNLRSPMSRDADTNTMATLTL